MRLLFALLISVSCYAQPDISYQDLYVKTFAQDTAFCSRQTVILGKQDNVVCFHTDYTFCFTDLERFDVQSKYFRDSFYGTSETNEKYVIRRSVSDTGFVIFITNSENKSGPHFIMSTEKPKDGCFMVLKLDEY